MHEQMKDQDDLQFDAVLPRLHGANRKQVLAALAEEAAARTGISARLIQGPLLAQEQEQSSGIGDGVALPHLKLRGIKAPCVIFARLPRPVEFDAVDGKPVDLALLLVSPESDGPLHLRRLARLTRLLRDEMLRRHLRGTDDVDALHALLSDPQSRRLAA
jgi:PTS system nitrogen regulatory IIA component